jgi:hypothetical protein
MIIGIIIIVIQLELIQIISRSEYVLDYDIMTKDIIFEFDLVQ